eukprot:TRINITY_DN10419_c0_g1_i1.p1 TRINITY_DN10419_c0_g1~~TRINITY_DN10419_c0_g1_i1.p1  ORF type:complete len:400 (-),score=40.47 TRINITY_DN10419_c0_g1_i1:385-1521(-)
MPMHLAKDTFVGSHLTGHDAPQADCMDVQGECYPSAHNNFASSNNPECCRNIAWAKWYHTINASNYPPGVNTTADFQCALYLKGTINGVDQPGPNWNCTVPPCQRLHAPDEVHGGTRGSVGTQFCRRKVKEVERSQTPIQRAADMTPPCSVSDGSAMSITYPCHCQGNVSHLCTALQPLCFGAPTFCAQKPPTTRSGTLGLATDDTEKPSDGMPMWPFILAGLAVAALVVGVGMCLLRKKAPPQKKRALQQKFAAPQHSSPAPDREAPPPVVTPVPAPLPEPTPLYASPPMYTAPPVQTVSAPLITYEPMPMAAPLVQMYEAPMQVAAPMMAPMMQAQPVEYSLARAATPAVQCSGCGNIFMDDSVFCRKCGAKRFMM